MRSMGTQLSEKRFPAKAEDYKLYEEIGEGVSASVYRALCIPLNEVVAIKVLDLEKCNSDLDGIRREVQTMSLIEHPNVLRAHCSFTTGHSLWVVMPYLAGGSCMHIMKSAYPQGFEEHAICTLLCETLKAIVYLHAQGHIHRDVKAGNILIDSNGTVKLADFGVSACMFDTGDRQRSRNTFVGTPCWMAPEVMQQSHGYDFKADIWSFGITALELAHGHAPFSKFPPMKVLLMTLQNAPPGLDYERDKRFSKSFKEMVAACLVKDPKKRPTSQKLLKHQFFKHARSTDYLARTILDGVPPLGERYQLLKAKEADLLVQNKALYENKERLSQQEYIRGISAWNFNLDDLKSQAALIQDNEKMSNGESSDVNCEQINIHSIHSSVGLQAGTTFPENANQLVTPHSQRDDFDDLEISLSSFPIKPLQALKGCFDVGEEEEGASNSSRKDGDGSYSSQLLVRKSMSSVDLNIEETRDECSQESNPIPCQVKEPKRFFSGSQVSDNVLAPREFLHPKYQREHNYSGSLMCQQRRDTNNLSSEDAPEGAVVTRKGRFKVISADLSPKEPTNCSFNSVNGGAVSPTSTNPMLISVLTSLHGLLQQNTIQRDEILRLVKYLEQFSGRPEESSEISSDDPLQISSTRERDMERQVLQLEQSNDSMGEELQRLRTRNAQLQKEVKSRQENDVV